MQNTINSTKSTNGKETNKNLPTWEEIISGPSLYEDCYTLDPSNVEEAWEKLGQSTLYQEIFALPAFIHFGLKKTYTEYFGPKKVIE